MSAAETRPTNPLMGMIAQLQDVQRFRVENWEGSFSDYLDIVREDPSVCRNAYQRLYDMIVSFGHAEYTDNKKRIVRYKFFDDPFDDGKDAVFGIDIQLQKLVDVLKSAALAYGPEKRVILLHGPVGSAKSTIAAPAQEGARVVLATRRGTHLHLLLGRAGRHGDRLATARGPAQAHPP